MSGLPKLPDRPKRRQQANSHAASSAAAPSLTAGASAPAESLRPADVDWLRERLQAAAPAASRLLQDPGLIDKAMQMDPNLRTMIAANPSMAEVLKPEKLQQLLSALQDPAKLLSQPFLPGVDLSQQRMNIMQLQQYSQQLHKTSQQQRQQYQQPGPTYGGASSGFEFSRPAAPPSVGQPQASTSTSTPDGMMDPTSRFMERMQRLHELQRSQLTGQAPLHGSAAPPLGQALAASSLPTLRAPVQPSSEGMWGRQGLPPAPGAPSGGGEAEGAGGGFSFTSCERDIPLHHLPEEVQERMLQAAAAAAGQPRHASVPAPHCTAGPLGQAAADAEPWLGSQAGVGTAGHGHHHYGHAEQYQQYTSQGQGQYGQQPEPGQYRPQGALDARTYYEYVPPSDWKPSDDPDGQDSCLDLYRRVYCTHADALFPPLWTGVAVLGVYLTMLPLAALVVLLLLLLLLGVYVFGVLLAGIPRPRLPLSRLLPSFIVSLQLLCTCLYLWTFMAHWRGATSTPGLLLAGLCLSLVPLHLTTAYSDPGYIRKPDKGPLGAQAGSEREAAGMERHAGAGAGGGGGGEVVLGPNSCWTCEVDRTLRSKHCPVCNRCVRRMDHHCPAVSNCIGEGNQRLFLTYLLVGCAAMLMYIWANCSFLRQLFAEEQWRQGQEQPGGAAAAAGSHIGGGGWEVLPAVLQYAAVAHRGLLLLLLMHLVLMFPVGFLTARALMCTAANLTTTELLQRKKLPYLNHELAGYSNRFDRGVAANCWQFWVEPQQDWWADFERGDREMVAEGRTLTAFASPGLLLRMWDAYERRQAVAQREWEDKRIQQGLKDLGVA